MSDALPLRYALPNLLMLLTIAGLLLGGYWVWGAVILTAIVVGPVDEAVGDSRMKLDARARAFITASLYAALPLTIVLTIVFLQYWTPGDPIGLKAWLAGRGISFTGAATLTPWGPMIGATLAAGLYYAIASANVAHELIHWTTDKRAMATGRALLGFTLRPGFSIAHVYGHHRAVGTFPDHGTARRGESLLAFVRRQTVEETAQAFAIEAIRLRRKGLSLWSWQNRAVRGWLYPVAIVIAAWWLAGFGGVAGFLLAAILGTFFHRTIDYFQHYGLVRVEGAPIDVRHTWDSYRAVSNALYYNMPRHSNHHMFAGRRAWELSTLSDAPMLPYGYKTMFAVSLIPPLFRRIMDPRLAQWDRTQASDAERALIHERGWEIAPPPPAIGADARAAS